MHKKGRPEFTGLVGWAAWGGIMKWAFKPLSSYRT